MLPAPTAHKSPLISGHISYSALVLAAPDYFISSHAHMLVLVHYFQVSQFIKFFFACSSAIQIKVRQNKIKVHHDLWGLLSGHMFMMGNHLNYLMVTGPPPT